MLLSIKVILVSFVLLPLPALAGADAEGEVIAEGGRLYDKWWAEYDLKKPSSTHPAYPATGKKKGASTWRCKECHGWDYRGSEGAYRKGSHFTGVRGINAYAGRDPNVIMDILKNSVHRYDKVMQDFGLLRIALFVSKGQFDINPSLDKKTNKVSGDIKRGKEVFNNRCMDCHGRDGRKRNFKDSLNPEYIGTLANKNPWEAIHKLRNGHPGAFVMGDAMPNMISQIGTQVQIDLLAYMQTLPRK